MAIGKSKKLGKGKGLKKRGVDTFSKKEWYDVIAPQMFSKRVIGKTIISRSSGTRNVENELTGRVIEMSLGDVHDRAEEHAFRKFKFRIEHVRERTCLTNFYGMTLTSDKLRMIVRKWQSTIEGSLDVTTTDGYVLRVFAIAFTKSRPSQVGGTSYCYASEEKEIRSIMFRVIEQEASCPLSKFVERLMYDSIGKTIETEGSQVCPLHNVFIRKVKVIRAPRPDLERLMSVHKIEDTEKATAEASN